jgi:hypothetical protein
LPWMSRCRLLDIVLLDLVFIFELILLSSTAYPSWVAASVAAAAAVAAVTVPAGDDTRGTHRARGAWTPGCGCGGNRARTSGKLVSSLALKAASRPSIFYIASESLESTSAKRVSTSCARPTNSWVKWACNSTFSSSLDQHLPSWFLS